ncbi:formate/nitrite transporter family protein [Algoriphagus halophytocola]|uniref:Formate/nitrite transporter family protein n=1 Tax=Algoriphagus halophytocola TaxID=2991499 RepID=A0ABY6MK45_9BACT|nr:MULTISPECIES: formate/nitrite transporter family protein [unclassified Algoriphagus]UZD24155.1 formate/nitrite transporter family protein [Algoriphagus sp. TR-M5]WBL41526.1 formate/nitrite transporter family protein [Algoriphagus sp. TR-M9]
MWKKEKTEEQLEAEKQREIDNELRKSKSKSKDSAKTHGEILRDQITDALETYDKSYRSLFTSSLTAGLEIGFSYLMICSVYFFLIGKYDESSIIRIVSLVYPLGFILVVLGQSILFTEQTALLTLPVLNKKRTIGSMLKLWGVVISGNLVGGYLMAGILLWLGPHLGIFDREVVVDIASHVLHADLPIIFVSAIVAGWLMGLLSWLLASSRDTISRIVMIFLITAVMSFTGLHHSIIGSVEVFSGMLSSPAISIWDYLSFQSTALLGNAFGGAIFVALLKYRAFVFNISSKN